MRGPALGVLAPLRERGFRLFALASLSSLLGDGFFRVAIAVQVYAISNDPRSLAAVAVAWAGSQVLLLPAGGWASDRFERRRVMILADLWRAMAVGAIGLLSVTGELELWHMLVLGAAFGAGNGFFNPAATSLIPDLLPESLLSRANAFFGVARPGMVWIVGPLLGGLVVGMTEPGAAFLVDGLSFLVSGLLLLAIVAPRRGEEHGALESPAKDIADGLRFVRREAWVGLWLLASATSTLAFHGPFDILLPYIFKNDFGMTDGEIARAVGFVLAAGGAGSIVASAAIGQRDLPRRFMTSLYGLETVGLTAVIGFGVMTAPWQAMVAGVVVFGAFALSEIIWQTTIQRHVPRGMLGRVSSLDWMASVGLALVSFAVAGPVGALVGAREVLVASGLLGASALLLIMLLPQARSIEGSPQLAPAEPGPRAAGGFEAGLHGLPPGDPSVSPTRPRPQAHEVDGPAAG